MLILFNESTFKLSCIMTILCYAYANNKSADEPVHFGSLSNTFVGFLPYQYNMICIQGKPAFAYAKTKRQISCAVTMLISAYVFSTYLVQSLYLLNLKFQASSHLLWLYIPFWVESGRKLKTGFLMMWLMFILLSEILSMKLFSV